MDALKDYGAFGLAVVLAAGGMVGPPEARVILLLLAALAVCVGFIMRSARAGIGASAFLAFGAAAYLFSLKLKSTEGPSLCNINEVFNCDVINTSAASEVAGVPIALLGMGLYMGIGIGALMKPSSTPRYLQFAGLINIVNIVYSVYLAYVASQIGAVCVMCLTMYAAHVLMLWGAIKGLKQLGKSLFDDIAPVFLSTSAMITVGTFGIITLVGMSTWNTASARKGPGIVRPAPATGGEKPQTPALRADALSVPRGPVGLSGTEPVLGNPNAPYMVIEFADYACPHCAMAAKEVKELVKMYPEVQVRFRPFPLTSQCNPDMERDMGVERCLAAMSGKCAQRQGKFWEMSSLMFANQSNLTGPDLSFMAGQIELDVPAWEACMGDPAIAADVQADALAGSMAGLAGTPTFFLKGTHGDRWVEVHEGVGGIVAAVSAHMTGQAMPEPGPPHDQH
jgi:protein-disulfide isomerase/uncharacterized membrane protein